MDINSQFEPVQYVDILLVPNYQLNNHISILQLSSSQAKIVSIFTFEKIIEMSTSGNTMATLVSANGVEVQATYDAVRMCITLANMLTLLDEEHTVGLAIPVPGVDTEPLKKVMEWCEHHKTDEPENVGTNSPNGQTNSVQASSAANDGDDESDSLPDIPSIPESMSQWDSEFFNTDKDMVMHVANAANYLECPLLLKQAISVIASKLRGRSTEEMRTYLNITNDFTAEEERTIARENAWANQS
ncbi:Skp1 family, dimerization domain-containing protein [Astrocystis sublimbata]|nr:Skp1 family, dimerization domain-containing protein [Astrocystis sublimbata]